jgi:Alr-MurF fusion protein
LWFNLGDNRGRCPGNFAHQSKKRASSLKYFIEHINRLVSGAFLCSHQNDLIEHLLTDSRKLIFPASTLFFALGGPRRQGDQFLEELYQRGVRNFVVSRQQNFSDYPEANIILVTDGLNALQQLAAYHRSLFDIPVIGITGSNGKTIVKEWLNQMLNDQYNIVRSPRSYNSQVGVPLSIWQMNDQHELAIFEAGISKAGEMENLERIIRPTIGVFTNIGEAHSEGFSGIENKIEEKSRLFDQSGTVIFNLDNESVAGTMSHLSQERQRSKGAPLNLMGWGNADSARLRITQITKSRSGTAIECNYEGRGMSFLILFTDDASIENVLTCICLLLYLKMSEETIQEKLLQLSRVAMRLELKSGINNCSVINDSYSVDINSLKIALDFMLQQQQHKKRTVILSDVLESATEEEKLYAEISNLLQEKKVDRLIGIGEKISECHGLFDQLEERDFYPSTEAFKKDFQRLRFSGETILIKGARVFEFEAIDRLLSEQIHQTVLEIDLNAMAGNLKQYQQLLRSSTKLMAMVKAFSYGGGSFEIANLLQFNKVDYLAVAYADEGIELRKKGISLPLMIMNPELTTFDALLQYHLEPVIYSFELLRLFNDFLKKEGVQQFPVHVELETGMNRLGLALDHLDSLIPALKNSCFKIQSVFTHLAASEEAQQDAFTREQANLFMTAVTAIRSALPYPVLTHISNSAAIVRHPELQMDMVRLGIGLYGIDPADSHRLDLQEVSTLKSTIAQIKELKSGETVGYNRTGIAQRGTRIATVGIGYADGYPRALGNGYGSMLVKGRLAPVIGAVCMDMTMIDITGIAEVQEGDEVIIFGKELPVSLIAKWAQTIPYEILTGVSQRVKRVYFEQ